MFRVIKTLRNHRIMLSKTLKDPIRQFKISHSRKNIIRVDDDISNSPSSDFSDGYLPGKMKMLKNQFVPENLRNGHKDCKGN